MNEMLNRMSLTRFVQSPPIASYEIFRNVFCKLYSVVLCSVAGLSKNIFCVAAFAGVYYDSFNCVFVVIRVMFDFTLSLRC